MNRPEEDLQRALVEGWAWRPAWNTRAVLFAVPNQRGTRSRAEAGVLAALGVRPGVSDLVLLVPGGRAVFIEVKAPGREGEQSPAQRRFQREVSALGFRYELVGTPERFNEVVTEEIEQATNERQEEPC